MVLLVTLLIKNVYIGSPSPYNQSDPRLLDEGRLWSSVLQPNDDDDVGSYFNGKLWHLVDRHHCDNWYLEHTVAINCSAILAQSVVRVYNCIYIYISTIYSAFVYMDIPR